MAEPQDSIPAISATVKFPWSEISGPDSPDRNFENLTCQLAIHVYGFPAETSPYGRSGQKQYGLDTRGQSFTGQRIGLQNKLESLPRTLDARLKKLRQWVDDYWTAFTTAGQPATIRVDRLILVVPWPPDSAMQTELQKIENEHATEQDFPVLGIWDQEALNRNLSPYPEIVERYFGPAFAREAQVFRGKRTAAATKEGVNDYLSISSIRDEIAASIAAQDPAAATEHLTRGVERLTALGFHIHASDLRAHTAAQLIEAGDPRTANRIRTQALLDLIERGSPSTIRRQAAHFDEDPEGAFGGACLAAQAVLNLEVDEAVVATVNACLDQSDADQQAHIRLILAEVAFLRRSTAIAREIVESITSTENTPPVVRARLKALRIDLSLAIWSAQIASNDLTPQLQWLAWNRQGQRLTLASGTHNDHIGSQDARAAFEHAAEVAQQNGMVGEAFLSRFGCELPFHTLDQTIWTQRGEDEKIRLGMYLDGAPETTASSLVGTGAVQQLSAPERHRNADQNYALGCLRAFQSGDLHGTREALQLLGRARLQQRDPDEALSLAITSGDHQFAGQIASENPQAKFEIAWLSALQHAFRMPALAAFKWLAPRLDQSEADKCFPILLSDLDEPHAPVTPTARELAIGCLAALAPSISSGNLLTLRDRLLEFEPIGREEGRAFSRCIEWIIKRADASEETNELVSSHISTEDVDTDRLKAIKVAYHGDESDLDVSNQCEVPSNAAAEALEKLLAIEVSSNAEVQILRSMPTPSGQIVRMWTAGDQYTAVSHMVAVATSEFEQFYTRLSALSAAAHIVKFSELTAEQREVVLRSLLRVVDQQRNQSHDGLQMFGPTSGWMDSLKYLGALVDAESLSALKPYLDEALFSSDAKLSSTAGSLLRDIAHSGLFPYPAATLAFHPHHMVKSAAVLVSLLDTPVSPRSLMRLCSESSKSVRSVAAQHVELARRTLDPADLTELVATLANDADNEIRFTASTLASQCWCEQ